MLGEAELTCGLRKGWGRPECRCRGQLTLGFAFLTGVFAFLAAFGLEGDLVSVYFTGDTALRLTLLAVGGKGGEGPAGGIE